MSASHGSRFPLAYVVRTGNQVLAKRLGASPNRPVWSGAAVQAPKERRSREATTRCIKGLENVSSAIFGPSNHSHTVLLDLAFSTNAPVGQTVPRLAVWTVGAIGGDALRASPPMEPIAKAKRHECPTCGPVTGSPNVDPKQRRSRLNLGLPWMLTMGGPLLWPTDHPRMPDKESRWMADRHITVCMPRVTLSIGVGWLKMEPGNGQTVGGASKQVYLQWRASKRARLDWPCR